MFVKVCYHFQTSFHTTRLVRAAEQEYLPARASRKVKTNILFKQALKTVMDQQEEHLKTPLYCQINQLKDHWLSTEATKLVAKTGVLPPTFSGQFYCHIFNASDHPIIVGQNSPIAELKIAGFDY